METHRITRRRLTQGALALPIASPAILGTSSLPVAIAGEETGNSVPMYQGNAARTGVMPGPGPDGVHGIEPLWIFSVEGAEFASSQAVVDGVVYFGSDDHNVYAIDAGTGEERWRFATGGVVWSSPAVVDGVVYAGGDDHNVYAIDAATGTERWRFATGDRFGSSPAVADGIIYIGAYDHNIYAIEASTGEERWRFATGGISFESSPAVVDGIVHVGCGDHNVYAIDAGSGEERWRFETGNGIWSTPAVADGHVYIGSTDGNVYALDARNGEERWRFLDGSSEFQYPAVVADGHVYIGNGNSARGFGNTVFALSTDTGEERWRISLASDESRNPRVLTPTYADGVVYVGCFGGFGSDKAGVYALGAETGEVLWWFATDGAVAGSVAVIDGVAYAASRSSVCALVARTLRLEPGATARVVRDTALRGGPSSSAVEREQLNEGTMVSVTGDSTAASGGTWWPLSVIDGGREGWVIADDLEPIWPED